jgi:hypothetical protein
LSELVASRRYRAAHPRDITAVNKPLMVGYNRDETVFFFNQQRNT